MRRTAIITPRDGRILLLVPETPEEMQCGANGGIPKPFTGLVFNYDPPAIATMTMKKTPMALQIAFVGPDRIVHYVHEAPARSGLYMAPKPARWVIETFLPWHVFQVGDEVVFTT